MATTVTSSSLIETLSVRVISREDAATVAELSVQLGYEATAAEVAERIEVVLSNVEQVALVACVGADVVGWIEASIVHHLQSAPHALIGGLGGKDGVGGLGVGKRRGGGVVGWERGQG